MKNCARLTPVPAAPASCRVLRMMKPWLVLKTIGCCPHFVQSRSVAVTRLPSARPPAEQVAYAYGYVSRVCVPAVTAPVFAATIAPFETNSLGAWFDRAINAVEAGASAVLPPEGLVR